MIDHRAKSIQCVPGDSSAYADTVADLLAVLEPGDMLISDFLEHVKGSYEWTHASARTCLYSALRVLGLVDVDGVRVGLTDEGRSYLQDRDPALLGELLRTRITAVDEILEILSERPRPMKQLCEAMWERGHGIGESQLRYRLRWLRTAGVVKRRTERDSSGRYPEWAIVEK